MLYPRDDIPSKQIKLKFIENEAFKGFFVEANLRKKKWVLCSSHIPDKNNISSHLFLDPVKAAILKYRNHLSLHAIIGKISKLDN